MPCKTNLKSILQSETGTLLYLAIEVRTCSTDDWHPWHIDLTHMRTGANVSVTIFYASRCLLEADKYLGRGEATTRHRGEYTLNWYILGYQLTAR